MSLCFGLASLSSSTPLVLFPLALLQPWPLYVDIFDQICTSVMHVVNLVCYSCGWENISSLSEECIACSYTDIMQGMDKLRLREGT